MGSARYSVAVNPHDDRVIGPSIRVPPFANPLHIPSARHARRCFYATIAAKAVSGQTVCYSRCLSAGRWVSLGGDRRGDGDGHLEAAGAGQVASSIGMDSRAEKYDPDEPLSFGAVPYSILLESLVRFPAFAILRDAVSSDDRTSR